MNHVKIPSFALERQTRGLNRELWGFVGVISLFTVGCGVKILFYMIRAIMPNPPVVPFWADLTETLTDIIVFSLMFGIGLICFLQKLMTAYVFEEGQIVRGRIVSKGHVSTGDLTAQAASAAGMLAGMTGSAGSDATVLAYDLGRMHSVLSMIHANMTPGFADAFWGTDLYRKKVYRNPRLLKRGKYTDTYLCEGNKKLRINRIYTGTTPAVPSHRGPSIAARVAGRSLLVLLLCFSLSLAGFFFEVHATGTHTETMQDALAPLEEQFTSFGYTVKSEKEDCIYLQKEVSSDRTSYIKITINRQGKILSTGFQFYYNQFTDETEKELRYILSIVVPESTEAERDEFIRCTEKTVQGEYTYDKISTESDSILIGTSDGYADIH